MFRMHKTGPIFWKAVLLALGLALLLPPQAAMASACSADANIYRSASSGTWEDNATWEVSTDGGTNWNPAGCWPTNTNGSIQIRNGHVVTITGALSADETTIDSGGQATVNDSVTWTIANGSGTDLTANGAILNAGTITTTGTVVFNNGSIYRLNHTTTNGAIPTATWNTGSTVEIVGYTDNSSYPSGLVQTFSNFTWNCPSQTRNINLSGNLRNVNGELKFLSTGAGSVRLTGATALTLTVGGNLTVDDSLLNATNSSANPIINIGGDLYLLSGGTLDAGNGGSGAATIRLSGDWENNGGTFNARSGEVVLNGSSAQNNGGSASTTFNSLNISNSSGAALGVNQTVNGTLAFTSGKITTGANALILGDSGSVTGAGAGKYVKGNLRKTIVSGSPSSLTFEVGGASNYAPISLTFSGLSGSGTLTGSTTDGQHPNYMDSGISSDDYIGRYWTLTPSGLTFTSYNATFTFVNPGDLVGSPSIGSLALQKYSAGWTNPGSASSTSTTVTGTGFTSFSDYLAGNNGVPTPVTLSYFLAQRSGETVNFEWSTATESGNLGFNLYAADNGTLVRLNAQLIPSQAVDSLRRLDYSFAARSNADTFYIEDLAIDGSARRHGPFQLAEPIGSRIDAERMDWAAIASEHLRADNARQARLLPDLTAAPASPSTLLIQVDQSGLYRLTYEMLLDAGLDLRGTPLTRLHLLNNGQRIPITVNGRGTFGPGAYLEFYGEALDTLYTRTNVYTLEVSNTPPARIPLRSSISRTAPLTSYTETLNVHNQKAYANYAPGNDPWYDTLMQVDTSPESWAFPFTVSGLANPANPASLQLTLWGVTDWPQASDHHVIVKINGTPVADELFDGLTAHVINVALPGGLLLEGNNSLEILLPGDTGVLGEVINLDRFSVSYQRMLRAENGRLTFSSSGGNFTVSNLPSRNVVVYRLDASGLARLGRVRLTQSGATFNAAFASNGRPATYFVYDASAFLSPNFEVASTHSDLDLPAQYLIISHPNFIADLAPLVQARQAQGFTVNVVDVNDLYARYAHHTLDPQAIRQYLAYAEHNLGTQYVLLVGGDSYDYLDHLGAGSLSFIPSLYVPIGSIARFTPADALYADTDGDNAPNLALGRFPVRTRTELQTLIQKTLAYASKDYGLTATFSADRFDGVVSYRTINDDLVAALPNGWTVENIYLDDLSTAQARTLLLAAMNRGTALVTYTGHSAPSMWNYSSFFNSAHANSLSNAGRPFVAVQYGCWNNYYVDPLNNTLAHSLLVGGDRGAAASIGASTLVDSSSEALFGALLTPRLTTPAMTIGQAFLSAKQNLAYLNPSLLDVLLGYSLLGDPALVVQQ